MVTYAPAHNGGRTQTNPSLAAGDYGFPLLNHFKNASMWSWNSGTSPMTPDALDTDGYLKNFANGGVTTSVIIPSQAQAPGNYVVGWSGGGTLVINGVSDTSGRYILTTPASPITIKVTAINSSSDYPHAIYLCHAQDETSYLAGGVFGVKCKQRLREANFGVLRMMNVQGSPFTGANGSQITDWASRKPVTYAFYSTYQWRPDLYCGSTTNTGNAYSVAAPTNWKGTSGGLPTDKQTIHVLFGASASAAPATIAITGGSGGDTSAISILNAGGTALGSGQYPVANFVATLVYDATLNGWVKQGGSTQSSGIFNGWPPEVLLQLCGEIGAHPHWVTPHFAASAQPTDYSIELAVLNKTFRDTNCSWMKPRVEGQNELWNPGGAFSQTAYAGAVGAALWAGGGLHDWYGMHMSFIGQMWATVFGLGNLGTSYAVLCGVQTATGTVPSSITSNGSNFRLSASKFLAQAAAAPSLTWTGGTLTFTKTAPAVSPGTNNLVSHVVVANYFNPGLHTSTTGTPNEVTLAAAFAGGDATAPTTYANSLNPPYSVVTFTNGTPGKVRWPSHPCSVDDRVWFVSEGVMATGVSTVGSTTYFVKQVIDADNITISTSSGGTEQTFSGTPSGTSYCFKTISPYVPLSIFVRYKNWKAWALTFGVSKMCGYEGGYSPDYGSLGTSDIDKLRAASKLVTTMTSDTLGLLGARYKDFLAFTGLSDGSFTAEYPSDFLAWGPTPSTNAWSLLEDLYQSPNPPQWEAIRLFNARLKRVSLTASA